MTTLRRELRQKLLDKILDSELYSHAELGANEYEVIDNLCRQEAEELADVQADAILEIRAFAVLDSSNKRHRILGVPEGIEAAIAMGHDIAPTENFGKKKGDLLDGMIHYAKVAEEKVGKRIAMQERAERELLRIRYNLKGAHQTEIDRLCDFLLREEKEGRTIEKFVEWVFADGFWVSKISSAQKVMELFYRQEELRPAKSTIPDYVPEEKHAVPNPFQKPAILRRPNSTDSTEGE